ncbi:MAG: NAD-dependent epimerase/dehydratase family protein [SAR202 cluster bacterium]|nr:NAD-dependent epimerase/dehydratase family protein [SAR202 cluster bacterium]
MANYLLTGAAGFIASRVAGLLLSQGHRVTGIDNINDAYDVRLKEWRLGQLMARPGFQFQPLDICEREALRRVFHGELDAVINLAARAGVRQSVENPWVYVDTNVTGTLNLLELCREFGVKKFLLASTSSLYGGDNPRPFREDANTNGPLSPYAASKKAAEVLCYTYHYLYGIDVSIPRYFTVYGPAGRPDMSLFRFVQWISEGRPLTLYGDGTQSRDFTYVDDIARGTVAALKPMGYEIINLGSDRPAVLMDAIHMVEQAVERKAKIERQPRHPADVLATWADISKARKLLNWEPQTTLEQGIQNLAVWYQENRQWAKDIQTT